MRTPVSWVPFSHSTRRCYPFPCSDFGLSLRCPRRRPVPPKVPRRHISLSSFRPIFCFCAHDVDTPCSSFRVVVLVVVVVVVDVVVAILVFFFAQDVDKNAYCGLLCQVSKLYLPIDSASHVVGADCHAQIVGGSLHQRVVNQDL